MKKLFMLATAALLFSGAAFAEKGKKGKGKKKAKSGCCKKSTSCNRDKTSTDETTVKL